MSRSWWVRSLLAVFLIPWALPAMVVFTAMHLMSSRSGACSTA
jgi:hypothetical protein